MTPVSRSLPAAPLALAAQARERFTQVACAGLPGVATGIQERLDQLIDEAGNGREVQVRRDAWAAFREHSHQWVQRSTAAWQNAARALHSEHTASGPRTGTLELMGKDVVENHILSSRLSLSMLDHVSWELNDLRLRVQHLEASSDLPSHDVLRPEVLAQHLVAQWLGSGLSHAAWNLLPDVWPQHLAPALMAAYHEANVLLVRAGVMAEIDLRPLVRRTEWGALDAATTHRGETPPVSVRGAVASSWSPLGTPAQAPAKPQSAESVLDELMRVLGEQAGDAGPARGPLPEVSPGLLRALRSPPAGLATDPLTGALPDASGAPDRVLAAARSLRQHSTELKQQAGSAGEKAIIEVVALMFQSILTEERIPAVIRVWFARLQMPVLRVALAEPAFFGTLNHPARLLIDRMGACAMGFDASTLNGQALELEIRRVVQVIEQYPETGRRVFQLVLDEFQKFLAKHLTSPDATQRVVTVAQQVEQRETLSIQYTIELRNLLKDMPVRESVREFLFKIWAEVLAMADIRNGPQHADTLALKRCAADLVWAASAKPTRHERARVIANLPSLLKQLRVGMDMLGLTPSEQERRIKGLSDTLAEAFQSRTEPIAQAHIEAMAQRLSNLEDYLVADEGELGGLPLDAVSIELMVGVDASSIEVLADADLTSPPPAEAWALLDHLQLGAWHTLRHNHRVSQVQFVWQSARRQLMLFSSSDGLNFLVQVGRVAAALAKGDLVPQDSDALTLRATRDALDKLSAEPGRLLG